MRRKYLAVAALLMATVSAKGGTIVPYQATSIDLAGLHGFAYYSKQSDGFRIVATLAESEASLPVRFEATLADRQTLTISVPRELGETALSVEFSRAGDKLIVEHRPEPDGEVEPLAAGGESGL